MKFKSTKQKLLTAAMALLLSAGMAVPGIASAPAVFAAEGDSAGQGKGSIMLDTANYIMAPGNIYDVGVTIKDPQGNTLSGSQVKSLVSAGKLKVRDSRTGSIADLRQLPNGNFRVTGKNPGTCYIIYEIGGTHASVKIDVQRGVKQHGTAVRNTSYLTQEIGMPSASQAVVGTWKIGSMVEGGTSYTMRNYFIKELRKQGMTTAQINSAEGVQVINMMVSAFDSLRYTFNSDGSVVGKVSANGQTSSFSGTYTFSGGNVTVTMDGDSVTYLYNASKDVLTVTSPDLPGVTMVLVRA